MNFAPYQSSPPESTRALSPPLRSPTNSPKPSQQYRPSQSRQISSIADNTDPWAAARGQRLPSPSQYQDLEGGPQDSRTLGARGGNGEYFSGRGTDVFETSLGVRMEIEACLAYLVLPPAGGVILLILEHKSDYVR